MYKNLVSTSLVDTGPTIGLSDGAAIWIIIAGILAFIGGILLFFLFVNQKKDPKAKFAKWLKDFLSFKVFWLETIMKISYYIATIFVILFSFTFLSYGGVGVLVWLMMLVLGPIAVRLTYELTMMFVMIWHNTREIADNTKKK